MDKHCFRREEPSSNRYAVYGVNYTFSGSSLPSVDDDDDDDDPKEACLIADLRQTSDTYRYMIYPGPWFMAAQILFTSLVKIISMGFSGSP